MGDEQVTLRDGTAVLIRPVQPEDKQLFVARLGVEINIELAFEPTGLGAALRAAAKGLVRLRP